MSRLRQDALTGRWVICAPGRSGRPNEFPLPAPAATAGTVCPFCPGNEAMTTPEVAVRGRADGLPANGPGWKLRCFPNKYPALAEDPGPEPADPGELFPALPGAGGHEVLVCTPRHEDGLADLPTADLAELLDLVREREAALAARWPGHHVLTFLNQGPEAGATIRHLHLQLLAVGQVPPTVLASRERLAEHFGATGRCLACDLLAAERAAGVRVVEEGAGWTTLAPWASRFPYEAAIWPRRHLACLQEATDAEIAGLAEALGGLVRRQGALHGEHSFNVVFNGIPRAEVALDRGGLSPENGFHWHATVTPRLVRMAGLETGSGFFINPVEPEAAADRLRAAEWKE